MNRRENNTMNMFVAVSAVFAKQQETINAMPAFANAVVRYNASVNVVSVRNGSYLSIDKGATAAKNSAAKDAIGKMTPIQKAICALAYTTNDEELKAKTRLSVSRLTKCCKEELERRIGLIVEIAQTHATDLAPYTITGEMIEALRKSLETLRLQADTQQQKIAGRKANRQLLYVAVAQTSNILREEIDNMMDVVKTVNIEFYHEYWAARVVVGRVRHAAKNGTSGQVTTTPQAGVTAKA